MKSDSRRAQELARKREQVEALVAHGVEICEAPSEVANIAAAVENNDDAELIAAIESNDARAGDFIAYAISLSGEHGSFDTVPAAVGALGCSSAGTVAASLYAINFVDPDDDFSMGLWKQALATAISAQVFANAYGRFKDSAFAAGVFCEVGRIALNRAFPEAYQRVLKRATAAGHSTTKVELTEFGFTHTEVGAAIAKRWRQPTFISDGVHWHHAHERNPYMDMEVKNFARMLHLSENLASQMGIALAPDLLVGEDADLARTDAAQGLRISTGHIRVVLTAASEECRARLRLFPHADAAPVD